MGLTDYLSRPEELARRFGQVRIEGMTLWLPDSFVPEAHAPLDFVFALHADHVTWLSPTSRAFRPLDLDARFALVDAARATCAAGENSPIIHAEPVRISGAVYYRRG